MRGRVRKRRSLLKETGDLQPWNAAIAKRPGWAHLPRTLARELTRGGREYEVRPDPPPKVSLFVVRPGHYEQIKKLEVIERRSRRRALVAGNCYNLNRRTNELLQRREQF